MRLVQLVSAALVPLTFLGFLGCSETEDPRTLDGNRYHNPSIGLSLLFPAQWQLKLDETLMNMSIDLVARGPAVDGKSYTDFAARWKANTAFPAIQNSMPLD